MLEPIPFAGYMEIEEMNKNELVKPFGWFIESKEWGEYDFTLANHEDRAEEQFVKDGDYIALYTHPVKELTDEEIKSEAKYFCHNWHSQNPERLVLFARAILRKAQE